MSGIYEKRRDNPGSTPQAGMAIPLYDPQALSQKWHCVWQENGLYQATNDSDRPKQYILDFFPYPSGDGLSVGHCRNYVPTCVASRFRRMQGYDVLHPMGWDAFGLPAENYAISHRVHPRLTSTRHAATYKRQMNLLECSYDWSREISSTDPNFYRWTQWLFLLLHQRGLAYQSVGQQWWCPSCQTILANEQVEEGVCWRCDTTVTKKALQQWYFRITDYAQRLIEDLEDIDWPDSITAMQRNWIGRSDGAIIRFPLAADENASPAERTFSAFTTRPDTLYGVTFLALAPEHPLLPDIVHPQWRGVLERYIDRSLRLSDIERQSTRRAKSGVFSGAYAKHPLTGEAIPIWIADYVLPGYGGGAVMGVPAHDLRDHAFASRYDLPIKPVIVAAEPDGEPCYTGLGTIIESGPFSGLPSRDGGERIVEELQRREMGEQQVTYRLRDWLISRQRYWGAPIPIIHCPDCGAVPVPEGDLPVVLPDIDDFIPGDDGRSPLARIDEWVNVACPQCGQPAQRESDTMDGFACSSWYFLRFASPHEQNRPFDPQAVARWLPVDVYVGGAEHAVLHLLYARFWTKVLYDAGLIAFHEPFQRLRNQGVMHAADGLRMSKSKGNVVTPDEVIADVGSDALRAYILFLGPFDADATWDTAGIRGVTRFLERYWNLAHRVAAMIGDSPAPDDAQIALFRRWQNQTIRRVTADFEAFKFNTALAALMEYLNYLMSSPEVEIEAWREAIGTFTLLLAPIAPTITEEVWHTVLGRDGSVHEQAWPDYDQSAITAATITIVVQVNGRVRARLQLPAETGNEELRQAALSHPAVMRHVAGKAVQDVVVIPGRLVNVVTQL